MARTYVVTGAASGIGKTTANILTARGDKVIGVDLKGVEVSGDLSTPEGRVAAAEEAARLAGGTVDAVIACAGLAAPKSITARVNYFGMTEFLNAMQPALAKSEAPRVALVSSIASTQPTSPALVDAFLTDNEAAVLTMTAELETNPRSASAIYSASKRAISRWVRREAPKAQWAGAGIPVNAVGPGTVITPMTKELLASEDGAKLVDATVPMPLNYHQPAESIANLLIWLTEPQNTHVTGQTIYCDGGAEVTLRGEDVWAWNDDAINDKFAKIMADLQA